MNNPADALDALDQLYADAACLGTSVAPPVTVGGGQSGTLHVTIPRHRQRRRDQRRPGEPRRPGELLPAGRRAWTDASAISGQDSPVEVLHLANITGADVGTWQIQLRPRRRRWPASW